MGLGKKLGQQNKIHEDTISKASTPVAEGGYNSRNLGLAPELPMTDAQIQEVQSIHNGALADIHGVTQLGHLVRPTVPMSTDSNQMHINELVVAKMWRIICLRRLQNFYTQEKLQVLVNRACMTIVFFKNSLTFQA